MKIRKPVKTAILLILFAVCANAMANHLSDVSQALAQLFGLLSPILIGFIMAFLLSIPVNALEKQIIKPHGKRALRFQKVIQRPLSIILSILLIIGIVGFISYTVIPNLVSSLHVLLTSIPRILEDLKLSLAPYKDRIPTFIEWLEGLTIDWSGVERRIVGFFENNSTYASQMINIVVSTAFSIFGKMFSIFLMIVITITAVAQKERICLGAKNALYAYAQPAYADSIAEYIQKIGHIFSNFISGQVLEAFILGIMVLVGMLIFRFPNALAISALIMLMAFIPVIGAWVSAIVGAIMILASAGIGKALGFIFLIIVLQQIEGNIIYPRVMGKRVGLPSLWVLVAITVGGGAFGAIGMLIFVPVFAVVYQLFQESVEKRRTARQSHNAPDQKL